MKKIFLILIFGIFLINLVNAGFTETVYSHEGEIDSDEKITSIKPLDNVNVIGFVCEDRSCSKVSSRLWEGVRTSSGNEIILDYQGESRYGYGIYMYKKGYIPSEGLFQDRTSGGPSDLILTKKKFCGSNVEDFNVDMNGREVMVSAKVSSPIEMSGPLSYVPQEIASHYMTKVSVTFEVTKKNGGVVKVEEKQVTVDYSGEKDVSFSTILPSGEYYVSVSTSLENEDKCIDYEIKEVKEEVIISGGNLEINKLECFDKVVEGNEQYCSIGVVNSGRPEGEVDVSVFYSDGDFFGKCKTDGISGMCSVSARQDSLGNFEVYAVASKENFVGDYSKELRFSYDVINERYIIKDLKIYGSDRFTYEDYDFYRGENMYVKFRIENEFSVINENLVSEVFLVSPVGGRAELNKLKFEDGFYFFELRPIPATHGFKGKSDVFAFVFDFKDGSGDQERVSLNIRNNLPVISHISDKKIREDRTSVFDFSEYKRDIEDSGDDLRWEVSGCSKYFSVSVNGDKLSIKGRKEGECDLVVRLYDLDGDYDERIVRIIVDDDEESEGNCNPLWSCSSWGSCSSEGVMTRTCSDLNRCGTSYRKPSEVESCGSSLNDDFKPAIILSSIKEKNNILWIISIIFGIGILLLLFIIFIVVLKRRSEEETQSS